VVPKKDLPRKVAELWRGYLREDQSIKVVSYDPELNLLIVRASEAWLKDFLAQWVAAGR